MITGAVLGSLFPYVQLVFRGPDGTETPVNFHLDTGYNGYLALPSGRIERLGLSRSESDDGMDVELADGSTFVAPIYDATVVWDGQERTIPVLTLDGEPLLGTSLLFDHEANIHFVNGGSVRIGRKG